MSSSNFSNVKIPTKNKKRSPEEGKKCTGHPNPTRESSPPSLTPFPLKLYKKYRGNHSFPDKSLISR